MHRSLADDASAPIHEVDLTPSVRRPGTDFNNPSWIGQWLGDSLSTVADRVGPLQIQLHRADGRAVIRVDFRRAGDLNDDAFANAAREIYRLIATRSRELALPHPLRIWNYIPNLHDRSRDGDRYMTFNAARFEAMKQWLGEPLQARVPAASGVGSEGGSLTVVALLSDTPGVPVENPRQVPAYQYSSRFGRLPPCFARATRSGDQLFIAGTAAIVGEESQHLDAFDQQLAVTLDHLKHLLTLGFDGAAGSFQHFRVYLPNPKTFEADRARVIASLLALGDAPVEIVPAALCRRELLVEIEALAKRF